VVDGRAISIRGGKEAARLREILSETKEESAYTVCEIAFGLNYKGSVVGNIIEDEGVYGTGHFAWATTFISAGSTKRRYISIWFTGGRRLPWMVL
jgi:leucyl aminopeptidase (aminopeptidase T)